MSNKGEQDKTSVNQKMLSLKQSAGRLAAVERHLTRNFSLADHQLGIKTFVDQSWIDLKLEKSERLNHDVKKYTFALPSKKHTTGLHLTSAVLVKVPGPDGKEVIRPYTPVNQLHVLGYLELIVKEYPNGVASQYISHLKENDTLPFSGPVKKFPWVPGEYTDVVLLGAGSGITPLYQLIQGILYNPLDKAKVTLIYGNKTEEDIILKEELEKIALLYQNQFKLELFVDKASPNWKGNTGYITKEFLKEKISPPGTGKTKIFVCGPPPFYQSLSGQKVSPTDQGELTGILAELGYSKDEVFKF